ncbi:hypothetical protein HY032_01690 [Candidatus Gottesmanbacteria bacterium]|nr:hypothetical protein [Candidatus Gottesmanbacteria bacterium]
MATLIGLALGLVIAGAFIFGPRLVKALPTIKLPTISLPKPASKTTPAPSPMPQDFTVTITAPLPDAVEPKDEVVVSGMTTNGATVVIGGPLDEDVVVAGENGAYAGKVTAVEGKNDISVTAYGIDGKQAQSLVTIYYTQEEFK